MEDGASGTESTWILSRVASILNLQGVVAPFEACVSFFEDRIVPSRSGLRLWGRL